MNCHKYLLALVCLLSISTYAQEPGSGYALNFDGVNDFANAHAADLTTYTDNFTIEFWVNPSGTRTSHTEATSGITGTPGNGQRYAVFPPHGGASNAGVGVSIGTNGVSVYEHGGGYMPALLVYDATLSGWTHIAVVYTARQPTLYVNGILVKTGLTSLRAACFPGGRIGGHPYGYYQGDMDEFRIWSTSRTQTQIRDNMCQKLVGSEAGLVRYLRVDNGAGTTITDVTGTQNATMSNMTPATDWVLSGASIGNTSTHSYPLPWSNTALDFDGVNDLVNGYAGDLTAATDNFTMEFWANPTGTITMRAEQNCATCISGTGTPNQRYAIYPQHGGASPGIAGAGVSLGTNGVQVYEHAGGYMPALASYTANMSGWNHIAVVYTAKQPTIYVNGVAVRTGLTSLRTAVFPGCHIGGAVYGFYQGQIDDVRIWNYSRSAAQINSNMCAELTGTEPGLIRYYRLNTGSGTTALDATGTNNGTLTNMTPASDWVATGAGACASAPVVLQSPELDSLGVSNFSGFTRGVHIYHVDALPNTTAGISGIGENDHYYGVFKAGEASTTTYTATYYYHENDGWQNSTYLTETDLALFTRSDNAATPWAAAATTQNVITNTLAAAAQSTEFILGSNGFPVPIELVHFSAQVVNKDKVKLHWQTQSEINNDYFTIERSTDATNWEFVSEVKGAGNSSTTINYESYDLFPYAGISYYRLKQTDFDGKFTYSNIQIINMDGVVNVNAFPNPVNEFITISSETEELSSVRVFNYLGQDVTELVQKSNAQSNAIVLDLSQLAGGVYMIKTKTVSTRIQKL